MAVKTFKDRYEEYCGICRQCGVVPFAQGEILRQTNPDTDMRSFVFNHVHVPAERTTQPVAAVPGGQVLQADGYERLAEVFRWAFDQAASGKGKERHANDKPFHEQPMQLIADKRGIGFILGQMDKKSEEAQGMLERGQVEAFKKEMLGAIVYAAGAIIFVEKNSK